MFIFSDLLKHILEKSPEQLNLKDYYGKTPLNYSSHCHYSGTTILLLEKNADFLFRDHENRQCLRSELLARLGYFFRIGELNLSELCVIKCIEEVINENFKDLMCPYMLKITNGLHMSIENYDTF